MIEILQKNLEAKLPAINAWKRMAVKSKEGDSIEGESLQKYSDWLSRKKLEKMKTAAVLIGLFEKENEWYFPLIKRPMHEKNHPGQMRFREAWKGRGCKRLQKKLSKKLVFCLKKLK